LGTIAANNDKRVNVMLPEYSQCLNATFLGLEFRTPTATQYSPALLNYATYISGTQWNEVIVNKSDITVANSEDIPTLVYAGTYHCPNGSVHTGSVTSARQYRNTFHFVNLNLLFGLCLPGHASTNIDILSTRALLIKLSGSPNERTLHHSV
jgi:hypothetical protein